MTTAAPYRSDPPPGARLGRRLLALLLALCPAGPAMAGAADLAGCLEAQPTLQSYAEDFVERGWRPVSENDAEFDRVMRSTAEIIGTLRTFPVAFTEPGEVRDHVERLLGFGRQTAAMSHVAWFARDGLALMVMLDTFEGQARLSCYLSGKAVPDVIRRLPEPGRNPSGEPLAWNVMSSGPLATPHIFAEIMYVRLFYQPAQHLLTGGDSVVTHLRFRREATAI